MATLIGLTSPRPLGAWALFAGYTPLRQIIARASLLASFKEDWRH